MGVNSMMLGLIKPMMREGLGEEPEEKGPEQSSSEQFLRSPEAREFVSKWADKRRDGKPIVTKRGVNELLGSLKVNSSLSDKQILRETDRILLRITGLDGFGNLLSGLKATSEGLMKGLKGIVGMK